MTLQEYCETLSQKKQIRLALKLGKLALPIWDNFTKSNSLDYRDTVVGLTHSVPKDLLSNTITEIEKFISTPSLPSFLKDKDALMNLYSCFEDPIVALQDFDWELPDSVKQIFYSMYNLTGWIIKKDSNTDGDSCLYISINQSIDAIENTGILSEDEIKQILQNTKNSR